MRTKNEKLTFGVTHGLLLVGFILAVMASVWAVIPTMLAIFILDYFMFFNNPKQTTQE